jgi:hypothetical protein
LWHLFQNVVLLDEQRNGSAYHSLLKRSLTQADVRRQFDKLPIDLYLSSTSHTLEKA